MRQRNVFYPSAATRANASAFPTYGLTFALNNAASSDVRLIWSGANLLPRTSHTAIWKANYFQQSGYYAVAWHSENTGSWPGSRYQYGTHPYPNDAGGGAVNGAGQASTTGDGNDVNHWYEMAGLGASDFLASPGGSSLVVVKGVWVAQARTCEVIGGTTLRHTFWPDVFGHPDFSIVQEFALSELNSPSSPAFYFGASEWRSGLGGAGSTSTDESPGCILRGLMLFDQPLVLTDIDEEASNESSNSAVTAAGAASIWYCNKNPTPSDISDRQGQRSSHSPSWANASRPTLYTG